MRFWWSLILIGLLVMATPAPQSKGQAFNFELTLIFPSDTIEYDFLSQAIETFWAPLFVDVQDEGMPRTSYFQRLNTKNFDIAVVSLDQQVAEYPPLWQAFSPGTLLGTYYGINSSYVRNTIGTTTIDSFDTRIQEYRQATTLSHKIQLAKEIQQVFTDELLLDIPIVSPSVISGSWKQFVGFDAEEGIIGSLFLGAAWEDNPQQRVRQGSGLDDIHYSILDFNSPTLPTFYATRGDLTVIQAMFSSLFLKDKHGNLHPNLAIAFNKTLLEDGRSRWTLHLRDDAKWSDGERVDAFDIKFTLDVVSFEWSDATNAQMWDNLESVEILDNTTVAVTFKDNSLINKFKLANEYIIPEHILNVSGIYEGKRPSEDATWATFMNSPVTAGPYGYNPGLSKTDEVEVFELNKNYWYPNEADSPSGVFNLTKGQASGSYYFPTDTIGISNLFFYPSSSVDIDKNTLITAFTNGLRDIIEVKNIGADSISGEDFVVASNPIPGSGIAFLFNLQNPRLAEYDIRKALTHAIDRSDLIPPFGLGAKEQGTPVSAHYTDFYAAEEVLEYDYEEARKLFLSNGYEALNNNTPANSIKWPWEELSLPFLPVLFGVLFLGTCYRIRRG